MKKDKKNIKFICFIAALLIFSTTAFNPCFGETPKKVAVFPFTMNSKDDLTFLQKGLFSMLSSRLTDPGKVIVLDREAIDDAITTAQKHTSTKGALNVSKARIVGANLGVDYVLFGSMTHFGDSFSIDGSMVDVAGIKPIVSFFEQSSSLGDAIPLVNSFAKDINQKIFNRSIRQKPIDRSSASNEQGVFQTPDNQGSYYQGESPFINSGQPAAKGFRKRFRMNDVLHCLAAGDLDNDGHTEIVTATDHEVFILKPQGHLLIEKKKLEYSSNLRIIAMDIADINKNGYPEIFISALTIHRNNLASFVIEYDDSSKAYKIVTKNEPYYYRVINTKKSVKTLLGQKKGTTPFSGKIYSMKWENSDYVTQEKIKMPRNVSVLSLAKGSIGDKTLLEYVLINGQGRLSLVNDAGLVEWKSREKKGGSKHYMIMPKTDAGGIDSNRVYFQPRLMFYDNKNDGKNELLVINNIEKSSVLNRYKKFVKGSIEIHSWNGMALFPESKTRTVQGWISDFALADSDNDGKMELLVTVVEREKSTVVTGSNRSYIISYGL